MSASSIKRPPPRSNGVHKKKKKKSKSNESCVSCKTAVSVFLVVMGSILLLEVIHQSLGPQFDFHRYNYQSYYHLTYKSGNETTRQEDSCAMDEQAPAGAMALCKRWYGRGTPASLWMQNRDEILKASRHPLDWKGQHDLWMEALFDLLVVQQPQSFARAWRTLPPSDQVERILDIVDKRLAWLRQQQTNNPSHAGRDPPDAPPPLRIAIFGGSVTEGTKCEQLPSEILRHAEYTNGTFFKSKWPQGIKGNTCAWPYRLQRLMDHFVGPRVIQVYNLGVGGTASRLAELVLKYWLYPKDSELLESGSTGPDIILNSYAVNDNLFSWDHDANGTTSMDNFYDALDRTQSFVRTALMSKPCHEHAPILGFVSEYHGNLNELLLAEDTRADTVRLLSDYYGFSYISAAAVVRPLVLVDADEQLLSPNWYKPQGPKLKKQKAPLERTKDGHFGMPGHVYTAWTMAYAALSMVVDHCDDMIFDDEYDMENDLDAQSAAVTLAMNRFLPPPVTKDLLAIDRSSSHGTLDDRSIPWRWRQEALASQRDENEYCRTSSKTETPCPFVFVATPTGTARTAVALNNYIRRVAVKNAGWVGENNLRYGWQNKIGLIAKRPGAVLHMRLPNIKQKIRHVIIQSLYSYGEDWADSKAQFEITARGTPANSSNQQGEAQSEKEEEKTTSFTIKGYHDMQASISRPFELDLGNKSAAIGQTVDIKITLIGGKTFKIIAMMFCSR